MLNNGASLDFAHAHSKEFEPDVWIAIAQHLRRPPTDPFRVDYKTGQGNLLSLVKTSKVSTLLDSHGVQWGGSCLYDGEPVCTRQAG